MLRNRITNILASIFWQLSKRWLDPCTIILFLTVPRTSGCRPPTRFHQQGSCKIYTINNKVGTDQAVGYTAWHADTRRERLQQGFDLIVCYVRPHLRLRLGAAAVGPVLVGLLGPAAGIEPAGLVALAALEAVFQRGASTWVTVLAVWVTTVGGGSDLHVTVLFTFVSQCWAAVRVACSVALENKRQQKVGLKMVCTVTIQQYLNWDYVTMFERGNNTFFSQTHWGVLLLQPYLIW